MTRRRFVAALVIVAVGGVGFALSGAWPGNNLHEVVPGRIHRSGQLSPADLDAVIIRLGLKHIVNLRGAKPGAAWYDDEVAVARRRGVTLHDLHFATNRLPPRPQVVRLIDVIAAADGPLLLHCDAGADRAGVASTIARIIVGGVGGDRLEAARAEMSFRYGHVWFGTARELGRFFTLYEAHVAQTKQPDSAAAFVRWVRRDYVPYAYGARIETLAFPSRVTAGTPLVARFRVMNVSGGSWRLSGRHESVKLGARIRPWVGPASQTGAGPAYQTVGPASPPAGPSASLPAASAPWRDFARTPGTPRIVWAGESVDFAVVWLAPTTPGTYEVKIDMVDETITWFEDQGSLAVTLTLDVIPI